jgi:tetrahydromethanopterin S-methyltransferase subunit G
MTMADTTDIEKKSLEAHVELCAERYRFLEKKLDDLEEKIINMDSSVKQMHVMMEKVTEKRNDQIIAWGLGIMGVLCAIIAWLASKLI